MSGNQLMLDELGDLDELQRKNHHLVATVGLFLVS